MQLAKLWGKDFGRLGQAYLLEFKTVGAVSRRYWFNGKRHGPSIEKWASTNIHVYIYQFDKMQRFRLKNEKYDWFMTSHLSLSRKKYETVRLRLFGCSFVIRAKKDVTVTAQLHTSY